MDRRTVGCRVGVSGGQRLGCLGCRAGFGGAAETGNPRFGSSGLRALELETGRGKGLQARAERSATDRDGRALRLAAQVHGLDGVNCHRGGQAHGAFAGLAGIFPKPEHLAGSVGIIAEGGYEHAAARKFQAALRGSREKG